MTTCLKYERSLDVPSALQRVQASVFGITPHLVQLFQVKKDLYTVHYLLSTKQHTAYTHPPSPMNNLKFFPPLHIVMSYTCFRFSVCTCTDPNMLRTL